MKQANLTKYHRFDYEYQTTKESWPLRLNDIILGKEIVFVDRDCFQRGWFQSQIHSANGFSDHVFLIFTKWIFYDLAQSGVCRCIIFWPSMKLTFGISKDAFQSFWISLQIQKVRDSQEIPFQIVHQIFEMNYQDVGVCRLNPIRVEILPVFDFVGNEMIPS